MYCLQSVHPLLAGDGDAAAVEVPSLSGNAYMMREGSDYL